MEAGETDTSVSCFFNPGLTSKPDSLAILQFSRDDLQPIYLKDTTGAHDGYAEGAVVNTKYGSFPHSTLLNVPWGSQIRASKVDTGSRGRKRKCRTEPDDDDSTSKADIANVSGGAAVGEARKAVEMASSGFVYLLPPTAELWTASLPHRTQVVYTPDYSYILHRIRARPGSRLIEAGAGSGSFTHASARAVYNGYPRPGEEGRKRGKVFSFEYDARRYDEMKQEVAKHKLEGVVQVTHRDVYKGGFLVDGASPEADAVFLDLPAPWEALPHLSRQKPAETPPKSEESPWVSPLSAERSVYLCTFSPCIEQVTRTVSTLRRLGWINIKMVELAHRKLHTGIDRVGLTLPNERGINNTARDVEEALVKLADVEERNRERSARLKAAAATHGSPMDVEQGEANAQENKVTAGPSSTSKPWVDGRLVVRGEPEIKTHTSYLVFAILPREWSEEEEAAALARWPVGKETGVLGSKDKEARLAETRAKFQRSSLRKKKDADRKGNNGVKAPNGGGEAGELAEDDTAMRDLPPRDA